MFYHLIYPLKVFFSPLNVFSYITFRTISAIIVALLVSYFFGKYFISLMKKINICQQIRKDGPQTHLLKEGTPTMGGVIIFVSLLVSIIVCARLDNRFILWSIFCIIWLGLLGFMDDYLKIFRKNSKGLCPALKFAGQMFFSLIVSVYCYFYPPNSDFATKVNIPYLKDVYVNLGILYILFTMFVIVGASNAVNLTDGLDGLAVGCLMIAGFTYAIFAYVSGHAELSRYLKIIHVVGAGELTVLLAGLIGSGLGFLWFNSYPAQIFMGDTGSLFLGGVIGLTAVFIKQEILLVITGGIFVIEVLSVILQVFSFRRYRKRIFRMAPLHHHFELEGWAEPKVTVRFWIIAIVLSLISLSSLKIR